MESNSQGLANTVAALELVSQTSTTIVAVPVPVVMKVLVALKVQMDYFRIESKLIGLCNRSV